MKNFFALFWNDKSVAERTIRALGVGVGSALLAVPDGPAWMKAVGVGINALAVAIGAGEKNPTA